MSGKPAGSDPATVLVLDMDGVIVESNAIKHAAMMALFADRAVDHDAVNHYMLAHGGVRRDTKIAWILEHLVGQPATPQAIDDHLARYARIVEPMVAQAGVIGGVVDFLADAGQPCYVSSAAPGHEVAAQLQRLGIGGRFAGVYASDTPKAQALRTIGERHPDCELVFFGDAIGDLQAARTAGVAFVGITAEWNNFAGTDAVTVTDFADPALLAAAMAAARIQAASR